MHKWIALCALVACTGGAADEDTQDTAVEADTDTDADTDSDVDTDADTDTAVASDLVDWVTLPAGTYWMGSEEPEGELHEWPERLVSVPEFAIMRTEVSTAVYLACEEDGACPALPREDNCYAGDAAFADHPANCMDWPSAVAVCTWLGGRLPSEAEWEYAARSLGRERTYPWGEEEPSCALMVMDTEDGVGCGTDSAQPPCSRPDGNTDQGLCDMAGNVFEWVEDWFESGYDAQPTDGSAHTGGTRTYRTLRGGGVRSVAPPRTRQRTFHEPEFYYSGMGVRCAAD